MRLFLLTTLVMIAFAANSVLNRMAVGVAGLDPALAGVVRLGAGAGVLIALTLARRGSTALRLPPRVALAGMATLFLYILGFTLANGRIDAGVGALILFGSVQITMFAAALIGGERVGRWRLIGAGVAFAGLAVLVAPAGGVTVDRLGAAFMAAGGLGWGLYSLNGRRARDPLGATAVNFSLALLPALAWLALRGAVPAPTWGIWPALVSGAVTSGLGYALWYAVVPHLAKSLAAVAQLSVPVLAALGGAILLAEVPGPRFWAAAVLVLGGIALSLRKG
ncbi:DMT family transporter [Paenirhodobacter hankyongi]|uniref:DMT family transporter n=1 Tax=Paenirhodobacter hankyongi TaxID=2294033 RepID=A0A421BXC0_9RHOB|nr:DMT family transporter [Sinirhodobacter hankyongi]RLL72919.1 DMT family transporter [Sinirhodobacter hankyongi]